MMQNSEFLIMRDCSGFLQIGSHMVYTVKPKTLNSGKFDSKNFNERNVDKMLVKVLIFAIYIVRLFCLVALL